MFGQRMFSTNRVDELRRDLDRLFNAFDAGLSRRPFARATGYPAVNIWDAGDRLCVEAELPGVGKNDLEILAVGNELTIKGRRGPMEGQWTYHRHERGVGEFARSITLPSEVDASKVEAVAHNGVLRINLPKAEAAKPRQITVKTA